MRNINTIFLLLLVLSTTPTIGCSSHRTTTTVETEPAVVHSSEPVAVTRTETKTVEVDTDSHSHGLFGILGDIIALPFRAVGALLSAIF